MVTLVYHLLVPVSSLPRRASATYSLASDRNNVASATTVSGLRVFSSRLSAGVGETGSSIFMVCSSKYGSLLHFRFLGVRCSRRPHVCLLLSAFIGTSWACSARVGEMGSSIPMVGSLQFG